MPKPGRSARPMPKPIDDTPHNVARAILTTLPKKENQWQYLKLWKRRQARR